MMLMTLMSYFSMELDFLEESTYFDSLIFQF